MLKMSPFNTTTLSPDKEKGGETVSPKTGGNSLNLNGGINGFSSTSDSEEEEDSSSRALTSDKKEEVSEGSQTARSDEQMEAEPPPKRRKKSAVKSRAIVETTSSDESESESDKERRPLDDIPTDIRFDPKNLEHKPKGLVDALSNFFTPGLKRTSRTAMSSLLKPEKSEISQQHQKAETPAVDKSTTENGEKSQSSEAKKPTGPEPADTVVDPKQPAPPPPPATAEPTTADGVKKVRISFDASEEGDAKSTSVDGTESDRKRHASAGQQQVKSLYDGLSHLYTDCDSRLRSVPMTNYAEKMRGDGTGTPEGHKGLKSPPRIASPHRMSDSELKEKEAAEKGEKTGEKTVAGDEEKTKGGPSKDTNKLL